MLKGEQLILYKIKQQNHSLGEDSFFFSSRRRHTRLQGDWSSDVCSSDLRKVAVFGSARIPADAPEFKVAEDFARRMVEENYMIITGGGDGIMGAAQRGAGQIGRASCRERG